MIKSNRFLRAQKNIMDVINKSRVPEDPSHARNVHEWLLVLEPGADEIMQLAALGHDIERALPDRYVRDDFATYEDYKHAHAERGGATITKLLKDSGYAEKDAVRAGSLVTAAEFASDIPDVQAICDADTISFFDNNLAYYRKRYDADVTKSKVGFMYERASERAKQHVHQLLKGDSEIMSYLKSVD